MVPTLANLRMKAAPLIIRTKPVNYDRFFYWVFTNVNARGIKQVTAETVSGEGIIGAIQSTFLVLNPASCNDIFAFHFLEINY